MTELEKQIYQNAVEHSETLKKSARGFTDKVKTSRIDFPIFNNGIIDVIVYNRESKKFEGIRYNVYVTATLETVSKWIDISPDDKNFN